MSEPCLLLLHAHSSAVQIRHQARMRGERNISSR
jgi:hypothetical protein